MGLMRRSVAEQLALPGRNPEDVMVCPAGAVSNSNSWEVALAAKRPLTSAPEPANNCQPKRRGMLQWDSRVFSTRYHLASGDPVGISLPKARLTKELSLHVPSEITRKAPPAAAIYWSNGRPD